MSRALLIGTQPPLEYEYVTGQPYDTVVIGSLTLSQLLRFSEEAVLEALAKGMPVVLYTPGLPEAGNNRALAAALASSRRELKSWGVVFTDGGRKRLITAKEAQAFLLSGQRPPQGSVLTPLAKEILEGKQ